MTILGIILTVLFIFCAAGNGYMAGRTRNKGYIIAAVGCAVIATTFILSWYINQPVT